MDAPHPPSINRELALALGLLFGATFALAGLQLIIPGLGGIAQGVLAVLLLAIPSLALRRTGLTIDDMGVGMGPWPRTLAAAGATAVIVFGLFTAGFHVYQTQALERRAAFSADALSRWDEELESMPRQVCTRREDGQVRAWLDAHAGERGPGLWIVGPPEGRIAALLRAPTAPTSGYALRCPKGGRPQTTAVVTSRDGRFEAPLGAGLWLPLGDARKLDVVVTLDGQPVAADRLARGEWGASAERDGALEGARSLWWLLSYLIVHLGLVALPEEWFFRGYLQTRLDARLGTPVTLLGARVGWGMVLSALAFALLHPILVPGLHRLAVFFPGLLFGWLRARTGNIGAAVLIHAAANLLQATLSRMYV